MKQNIFNSTIFYVLIFCLITSAQLKHYVTFFRYLSFLALVFGCHLGQCFLNFFEPRSTFLFDKNRKLKIYKKETVVCNNDVPVPPKTQFFVIVAAQKA